VAAAEALFRLTKGSTRLTIARIVCGTGVAEVLDAEAQAEARRRLPLPQVFESGDVGTIWVLRGSAVVWI
jgi:hypothetical protein